MKWREEMLNKSFVAVLLATGLAMMSQAHAGPSFLEAAIFYAENVEGLEVQRLKDATIAIQPNLPGMGGTIFMVNDDEPCTLRIFDGHVLPGKTRKLTVRHINFRKLPGPRSVELGNTSTSATTVFMYNLIDGAICDSNYKSGGAFPNMSCHKDYYWSGNRVRRLNALEYIRNNFCMGLPQPDPMPY